MKNPYEEQDRLLLELRRIADGHQRLVKETNLVLAELGHVVARERIEDREIEPPK